MTTPWHHQGCYKTVSTVLPMARKQIVMYKINGGPLQQLIRFPCDGILFWFHQNCLERTKWTKAGCNWCVWHHRLAQACAKLLWCSQLKYEDCQSITASFLTVYRHYNRKENILIQALWKYNKVILFFTMTPRNLSWHPDFMPTWREIYQVLEEKSWQVSVLPSLALWKLLMSPPSPASGATQLPGPPRPPFRYLSPPIWHFFVSRVTWFIIQITDICIVTIFLFTVCCIWPDMPKWPQLLMHTDPKNMLMRWRDAITATTRMNSTSTRPTTLLVFTQKH